MLANKLLGSAGEDTLYSDDVFTSYLRTGTGADTTVTTNIDMTKGYMLWTKGRSGATDHAIYDSARGVTFDLASNTTAAQTTQSTGLKAVSATGHTVGSLAKMNTSGATYVDFVFRKAPKFFDVVTYTGNGDSARNISHSLGTRAGMVLVKKTSGTSDWKVNVFIGWDYVNLALNSTNTRSQNLIGGFITASTPSIFQVVSYSGSVDQVNALGATYVAYLFAHDPSEEGIIQCGSFTATGSTVSSVTLGWEPQYILTKHATDSGGWVVSDAARGLASPSAEWGWDIGFNPQLSPNSSAAEASYGDSAWPTATGFSVKKSVAGTYVYLAIRRPNKPPTSGSQVYNSIARTGTGAAATVTGVGFAPDLVMFSARDRVGSSNTTVFDRLRGSSNFLITRGNFAERLYSSNGPNFTMDGYSLSADAQGYVANYDGAPAIDWNFKRAKGFFDIVCYTGDGTSKQMLISPSFGNVRPELVIYKSREAGRDWIVWPGVITSSNNYLVLNSNAGIATDSSVFTGNFDNGYIRVGTSPLVNNNNETYVAYVFASLAGVQYINSYVGDGTSGRVINCGFSSGARFICIKATSTTGSWWIFDSTRGILAAADPALQLNSTAAEITSADAIDPHVSGFIINQEAACSINASGVSYLVWAIA